MTNDQQLNSLKVDIAHLQKRLTELEETPSDLPLEQGETVELEGLIKKHELIYIGDPKPRRDLPQYPAWKPWSGGEQPEETIGRETLAILRDGSPCKDIVSWEHINSCSDVLWYCIPFKHMLEKK